VDLTETAVEVLPDLDGVRELNAAFSAVSDLEPLRAARDLRRLALDGTALTDLARLAALRELEVLSLSSTQVEDLSPLAGLVRYSGST